MLHVCPIDGGLRLFVPQRMYKLHTGNDRRPCVEEVRLSAPIIFEAEHPSEWGIALDDALKYRTKRLGLDLAGGVFTFVILRISADSNLFFKWPGAL